MATRARLTVSYAAVVMGAMVVFSAALWVGRKSQATEELGAEVLQSADGVLTTILNAQLSGKRLTFVDSVHYSSGPVVKATQELGDLLAPAPGYFMILGPQRELLYSSEQMRALSQDDQTALDTTALKLTAQNDQAIAHVRNDSLNLLLRTRRAVTLGPNIARVIYGLPTNTAELSGQLLLGTMIAVAPIILLVSIGVAYVVAGNAFKPVDQLINEVEAITDGRSLHRRLPADAGNDELSRLSITLNAMLTRLEGSFAALRRFTADASHELKTPLAVLRADVERAMHPGTTRPDKMVALEEALHETARMADLVESLLTLARADEGRFDLHRMPIELEPLMREVFETAVILGEDAGLTLDMPVLEDATVMGDRARLRQLLLNLVTNAIKYTPRGGHVELTASKRPNNEIAISVRDTGIGISANDLPYVFDRFWRADRVRSRRLATGDGERGGFGLGLSISQWIVQAHGGTLSVQSRLGRGTIFTAVLPMLSEEVPAASAGQETVAELEESQPQASDIR